MKEGWKYIDFKDVYPISMGKTPPRGDRSLWDDNKETHNKWVSIADISANEGNTITDTKEYISDKAAVNIRKVAKGSLLMSFKLSIGKMAFAGDDLYTNEAIIGIPTCDKYDLKFIYYYLLSYDWKSLTQGNEKVKGATLNKTSIGQIKLPSVPFSEQQQIVTYLDAAFEKVDAIKANAEKSLSEAKALFQSALKEMMQPKEGWEEKTLKEVVVSLTDGDHMPPPKAESGIPFITISNIDKDKRIINFDETFYVPQEYYDNLKDERKAVDGDILYTVTGSFGIPVIVSGYGDFCFQRHVALIRPKKDIIKSKYLYYWFLTPEAIKKADEVATGTAQRTVSLTSLRKFTLVFPEIKEQEDIINSCDALSAKVSALEANYTKTISECAALKQAILRDVFE